MSNTRNVRTALFHLTRRCARIVASHRTRKASNVLSCRHALTNAGVRRRMPTLASVMCEGSVVIAMDDAPFVIPGLGMTQIDDHGCIWVSGLVTDWSQVHEREINVIVDLEGDVDHGVPNTPDEILYVYLPIHDAMLPNLERLQSVARLVAGLAACNQRVLCHCGLGLNRSPLVAGLALMALGVGPQDVIDRIRSRRPGSLYNEHFVQYMLTSVLRH